MRSQSNAQEIVAKASKMHWNEEFMQKMELVGKGGLVGAERSEIERVQTDLCFELPSWNQDLQSSDLAPNICRKGGDQFWCDGERLREHRERWTHLCSKSLGRGWDLDRNWPVCLGWMPHTKIKLSDDINRSEEIFIWVGDGLDLASLFKILDLCNFSWNFGQRLAGGSVSSTGMRPSDIKQK